MDVNRRAAVPPSTVVMMTVVRMTEITMMIDMEAVGQPANCKGRGDAPEVAVVKIVAVRVRVVVNRVGMRVVVVYRPRLIHDDTLRLVVWDVDNVFLDGDDFDDTIGFGDVLIFVTAQIARGVGAIAEYFHGFNDVGLLRDDSFPKLPGPVEIFIQELNDFGVIRERDNGIVPVFVGLQR